MTTKLAALVLAGALSCGSASTAVAACYGFSEEEMPAAAAAYLCPFGELQAQLVGYQQDGEGRYLEAMQLRDQNGALVAFVFMERSDVSDIYRIVYLQDAKGNVILDRRASEQKGQPG